ncbi:MAG: GGDEF domain-containing protein [Gemmatimonadaceae bacterium]|jgi:diguanylate cyclase (GGDEF)-like protein|nr:GGDEF domain-containing protein [Gemmatimonadaceae bacterium]
MHLPTAILALGVTLLATGAVLVAIARSMPSLLGLRAFGVGCLAFGGAYLLRIVLALAPFAPLDVVADTTMLLATLAYGSAFRQFGGGPALARRTVVALLGAFALVSLGATGVFGAVGRHTVLNLALAAAYLVLASFAWVASRRADGGVHMPLRIFAGGVLGLGLLTAVRGASVPMVGVAPLFAGLGAQLYYGYSVLIAVVIGPLMLWMVFLRLNARLIEVATRDPLTQLRNRRGLDEALDRHYAARTPAPLVLLQVDVDHFKRINDLHGHEAGDAVLRDVAATLERHVRAGDLLARLGGEEFLAACSCDDADEAMAFAERLRGAVAALRVALPGGGVLACTVSIGVSPVIRARSAWGDALREADAALYAAKRAGRDRVLRGPVPPMATPSAAVVAVV